MSHLLNVIGVMAAVIAAFGAGITIYLLLKKERNQVLDDLYGLHFTIEEIRKGCHHVAPSDHICDSCMVHIENEANRYINKVKRSKRFTKKEIDYHETQIHDRLDMIRIGSGDLGSPFNE